MTEFEKYYQSEEIAGEYDELRFSGQGGEFIDHLEQHTVLSGLPAPDAGRILEIGCGTGRVTRTMLERGYDVLSVDPSAEMLDLARQRLADLDEGVRQRGELQIGNGFDLGGLPSTFAGALSLRVLIHMKLADVDRVLKQVYPRLESGGRFCFDTLSPWSRG